MTLQEKAIAKVRELPEPLAQEVNDFIDFLVLKQNEHRWQMWNQFSESLTMSETGIGEYAEELSEYEEKLANGEIRW